MRIDHVQIMIPAGREDEARGYYQGLLGFLPLERPAGQPGKSIWFRAGAVVIHLGIQDGMPDGSSRAHVAFAVPGAELERLRAAIEGADFEVREPGGPVRRFHTRDPFGNRLEFMEEA